MCREYKPSRRFLLKITETMKKILIQANNLDTVIDVFNYIYGHQGCKEAEVAEYCGFTGRQVAYYVGACIYLDLLNRDWTPTELARDIKTNNPAEVEDRIYQRIVDDDVIGQVYNYLCSEPEGNISNFALELVKEEFPGYSDAVYTRRSDNIVKWCKKIYRYLNN